MRQSNADARKAFEWRLIFIAQGREIIALIRQRCQMNDIDNEPGLIARRRLFGFWGGPVEAAHAYTALRLLRK